MITATIHDYVAYTRTQGAPHYDGGLLDLKTPTTALGAGLSTGIAVVSIGFPFIFGAVAYTSVTLSVWGWAKFSGVSPGASNANLFADTLSVVVAPWWDALRTADTTGSVRYELQGTAPKRRLVVDWTVYAVNTQTETDHDLLTFQVVLYEDGGIIEYRYGKHTVTGTPTGTPTASIGAKDDTVSDATARRDLAVVDSDHDLGGSITTMTTTLGLADFPASAAAPYNIRFEPNVPIPDYYDPIEGTDFVGRNRPDAQPIDRMGRNANFVLAHHSPPLANVGFFCDEAEDQTFVIPVRPSADRRTYKALAATFSSIADGGSGIDLVIFEDRKGAASQVGTAAHWAAAHTENRLGHAADNSEWWNEFDVALDHRTRLLKIYIQAIDGTPNEVLPLSLLLYPAALTALSEQAPSGAVPYAIAQLLQEGGGAIHKEIFNRLWASLARCAADLEQMVFSFVQSVTSKVTWSHSSAKPSHKIGLWGPDLVGQAGAVIEVRAYAKSTADGSTIVVGEEAGDLVELTIDANGGEYRLVTAQLTITRAKPTIYAHCAPAPGATVTALAIVGAWRPGA